MKPLEQIMIWDIDLVCANCKHTIRWVKKQVPLAKADLLHFNSKDYPTIIISKDCWCGCDGAKD